MLNHPFFHSDPPVAGSPNQAENPGEGATEESSPTTYEIGGEQYTEDQLETALNGTEEVAAQRRENEAAFTRQKQNLAESHREAEEMTARANALLARAERESAPADIIDETVPGLGQRLSAIEQNQNQLIRAQQEETQARAERSAADQRSSAMDSAIDSLNGRPFINDQSKAEIRREMERGGYAPDHVGTIYNARFGPQIGEQRGFQRAVREGAQAGPPTMGAGDTGISPGFTTPSEAPGAEVDISQQSWNDVLGDAMNDPESNKL